MPKRFSLRALLIAITLISVALGLAVRRIHFNRAQRDAEATLWSLGALTCTEDNPTFRAPGGMVDWTMTYGRTSWLDDLIGYGPPVAVLFARYDSYDDPTLSSDDVDAVIASVRRVPTIEAVFVDERFISGENLRRLRNDLPDCRIVVRR